MTGKIFFTSDTHFGHTNIITYCSRPWKTVGEMDREIAARWNEVVSPEDVIYHLGDFAFGSQGWRVLEKLSGRKYLILGNHDRIRAEDLWEGVYMSHTLILPDTPRIHLSHYPPKDPVPGEIYLHGHLHSKDPYHGPRIIDVGVDGHDYRPWELEEIIKKKD